MIIVKLGTTRDIYSIRPPLSKTFGAITKKLATCLECGYVVCH